MAVYCRFEDVFGTERNCPIFEVDRNEVVEFPHRFPLGFVKIHFLGLCRPRNEVKNLIIEILIDMIINRRLVDLLYWSDFHILHVHNVPFVLLSDGIIAYYHDFVLFHWKRLTRREVSGNFELYDSPFVSRYVIGLENVQCVSIVSAPAHQNLIVVIERNPESLSFEVHWSDFSPSPEIDVVFLAILYALLLVIRIPTENIHEILVENDAVGLSIVYHGLFGTHVEVFQIQYKNRSLSSAPSDENFLLVDKNRPTILVYIESEQREFFFNPLIFLYSIYQQFAYVSHHH